MRTYLDAMDDAPYMAARPAGGVRRLLAALKPKMLGLAAEPSAGAHPYFVPVEHTANAREIVGPGPLLAPEQAFVVETDAERARALAREHLGPYLGMANYTNNLRDLGYGDEDFADGGSDRLADAIVAWGDAEAIAARVQAHMDAGAEGEPHRRLIENLFCGLSSGLSRSLRPSATPSSRPSRLRSAQRSCGCSDNSCSRSRRDRVFERGLGRAARPNALDSQKAGLNAGLGRRPVIRAAAMDEQRGGNPGNRPRPK
jgi:hypothetical protein